MKQFKQRLPRASGDRPAPAACLRMCQTAAPRERGSTLGAAPKPTKPPGCPARAGIDPSRPRLPLYAPWLPRASGDRPAPRCGPPPAPAAAPRERGSTCNTLSKSIQHRGCPARAGIDLFHQVFHTASAGLPRASGDRPVKCNSVVDKEQAAPRERGSTAPRQAVPHQRSGCPARAGIDPSRQVEGVDADGLPRASGDRPEQPYMHLRVTPAAPRERGSTPTKERVNMGNRGCPARAGIDPAWARPSRPARRLPRASGDRPALTIGFLPVWAAAPRERGSTARQVGGRARRHGCPARAGIDLSLHGSAATAGGLPRASGDRPITSAVLQASSRAAPRERGSTARAGLHRGQPRGCPARAGIDLRFFLYDATSHGLPRASGDRPPSWLMGLRFAAAPPRDLGIDFTKRYGDIAHRASWLSPYKRATECGPTPKAGAPLSSRLVAIASRVTSLACAIHRTAGRLRWICSRKTTPWYLGLRCTSRA